MIYGNKVLELQKKKKIVYFKWKTVENLQFFGDWTPVYSKSETMSSIFTAVMAILSQSDIVNQLYFFKSN